MILELEGITKRFGGLVAVNAVSLGVEKGRVFGIIGPNGAGKTTLLNVIAGSHKPEAGTIRFEGRAVTGLAPHELCRLGISRTFQVSRPFPKLTAMENVLVAAVFGSPGTSRTPQQRALDVLEFVEFPMSEDTLAEDLNTLQLKRLDMARALASGPRLLLLDEVAAGLTPSESERLMKLVKRVAGQGIAVVVVEHVMRVITQVCDRVAVLHHGKKIAEGCCDEVLKNETVVEAYLGEKWLLH